MRQLIIKDWGVLRSIIIKEGNLPKIPLGGNRQWLYVPFISWQNKHKLSAKFTPLQL